MKKYKDVAEFCKMAGITEDQFYGKVPVNGDLDLRSVTAIPAGWNPTVGGSLWLSSVTAIPAGWNPTVGGSLYLSSVKEIPAGWNPTVGWNLYLNSVKVLPAGWNPTVGGSLDLRSVKVLPAGWNPTVGWNLYLNSVKVLPAGWNPTVGGGLFLRSVKVLPAGWNPTVGGYVYHHEHWDNTYRTLIPVISWLDGKYIKVDGIFTEVVSHRKGVYRVKKIGSDRITYLVTDGVKYAHGDTLAEARDSLKFKIGDRDTSKFVNLPLTHKMTAQETIECYRVITGACEFGVRDFINRKFGGKIKKSYTIAEVIKFTEGEYGHQTFKNFFVKE